MKNPDLVKSTAKSKSNRQHAGGSHYEFIAHGNLIAAKTKAAEDAARNAHCHCVALAILLVVFELCAR